MTWAQVIFGGIPLRESQTAELDASTLRLSGREMSQHTSAAAVLAVHADISQLAGATVPAIFTDKGELTGFYRVNDATSRLRSIADGSLLIATWQATLERLGTERDIEFASRVPTIARADTLAGTQTPSYWHAPPVGVTSYLTGVTAPTGSVARTSADGVVIVHTGIPTTFAPRWTVTAANYLKGSARILFDGILRVGTATPPLAVWEVHNGLVRLTSGANGTILVSCWDDGAWRSPTPYYFTAGTDQTATPELTVLRNDPEEVVIRLSYPTTTGRVTVDLGLRRGARYVTGTIKRGTAAVLAVGHTSFTGGTVVTGGVRQTTADTDGNRWVIGAAKPGFLTTFNAGVDPEIQFAFFVGHEVGTPPASGDAFADLLAQYIGGAGSERVRAVRR